MSAHDPKQTSAAEFAVMHNAIGARGGCTSGGITPSKQKDTLEYLAVPSAHLGHFSRCGALGPLAPVDVGRVVALFGEFGHEDMMGR